MTRFHEFNVPPPMMDAKKSWRWFTQCLAEAVKHYGDEFDSEGYPGILYSVNDIMARFAEFTGRPVPELLRVYLVPGEYKDGMGNTWVDGPTWSWARLPILAPDPHTQRRSAQRTTP